MKRLFFIYLSLVLLACEVSSSPNEENGTNENNPCDATPDPGPCKAYFVRYYFDKAEGMCKEFIWGGCKGVVPFNSLDCTNSPVVELGNVISRILVALPSPSGDE